MADAKIGEARSQKRLQITFDSAVSGANATVIQPPPSEETFGTIQNTLTVPLPIGRKATLAVAQAEMQRKGAAAAWDSSLVAIEAKVASSYYDVLRKMAVRDSAHDALDQAQRDLDEAQTRNRAGDVAELDVLQAKAPVASAHASLDHAESDVAEARQALNDLVGLPLDAMPKLEADTSLAPEVTYTLKQARDIAVMKSGDVREADAAVQADEAAVEVARLSHEPAYSLQATDTRSGDRTSFSREDSLQASIAIPLDDGGLGAAQVREAQATLKEAKAQAESVRRSALAAVTADYLAAQSARSQVDATREARDIAQTTYEKTIQGYESGLFPLIDVLSAENTFNQARSAYIQSLYDALTDQAALTLAVSGGLAP